jgi:hypothetical protein
LLISNHFSRGGFWDPIKWFNLTLPRFCSWIKPRSEFSSTYVMFFCSSSFCWYWINGGIVDHHCLNFLFVVHFRGKWE